MFRYGLAVNVTGPGVLENPGEFVGGEDNEHKPVVRVGGAVKFAPRVQLMTESAEEAEEAAAVRFEFTVDGEDREEFNGSMEAELVFDSEGDKHVAIRAVDENGMGVGARTVIVSVVAST